MIFKVVKYGVITTAGLVLATGLVFGTDAFSYLRSGARGVREAVKNSVPVEVELRRARDLLDDIIPEMHATVRLIAQEEVEIASLKQDIDKSHDALAQQRVRVEKLRDWLEGEEVAFTSHGQAYTRPQMKDELSHQFNRYKEAQVVLAGKEKLLETRQQSLRAAMQMLDRTRSQKVLLADKIESLEAQHRLVMAAAVGSQVQIDSSKLAQTEKLISEIRKRLDVSERVLAHESRFVQPIEMDVVSEKDLLAEVESYLNPSPRQADSAAPSQSNSDDGQLSQADQAALN